MSRKSAQMTACALRSLLWFLHVETIVSANLVDAVPPVARGGCPGCRGR
jgi:hypothetical protein